MFQENFNVYSPNSQTDSSFTGVITKVDQIFSHLFLGLYISKYENWSTENNLSNTYTWKTHLCFEV